jgi:hypothetical protein
MGYFYRGCFTALYSFDYYRGRFLAVFMSTGNFEGFSVNYLLWLNRGQHLSLSSLVLNYHTIANRSVSPGTEYLAVSHLKNAIKVTAIRPTTPQFNREG